MMFRDRACSRNGSSRTPRHSALSTGPVAPTWRAMTSTTARLSRRHAIVAGAAMTTLALARSTSMALHAGPTRAPGVQPLPHQAAVPEVPSVDPDLLAKALSAMDRHSHAIRHRDRIAIADFSPPSSQPRFHLVDIAAGKARSVLVAHGMGSDPSHTGFLHKFSNVEGSNASSEGAFLAADYYLGKHGRSQRLVGLDPTNDNALARSIVIHGAWYSNADMIPAHGKLGRSQGCFAVGEDRLDDAFGFLGEGRMVYAARA